MTDHDNPFRRRNKTLRLVSLIVIFGLLGSGLVAVIGSSF